MQICVFKAQETAEHFCEKYNQFNGYIHKVIHWKEEQALLEHKTVLYVQLMCIFLEKRFELRSQWLDNGMLCAKYIV